MNGIKKYFGITPLIVEPGIKTGINIALPNPKQLGADRIVDAVAAYHMYGGPHRNTPYSSDVLDIPVVILKVFSRRSPSNSPIVIFVFPASIANNMPFFPS